jgi:4-hydroxy-4-methyl-2-oxoglutarate aldolase
MTDDELIRGFALLDAATVFDCSDRAGDMAPDVRALFRGARIAGPAYTVKCPPGELTPVRRAVDAAPAGSVLVIECGGHQEAALWGGAGSIAAQRRGLAGVVTNGRTRDSAQIGQLRFPVFCAGTSVRGATRQQPGWTGVEVTVGGITIRPGDFLVGDDDGVVVVARERATAVLQLARKKSQVQAAREERLRAGEAYDA